MANGYMPTSRFGAMASGIMLQSAMDEKGNIVVDFTKGLDKFHHQVLILSGRCNTIIGPEHQEQHAALFNFSKHVVIEDAGHTMFGEKPKQCLKVIKDY
ncbi:MAG: alpha/beta hydrolase [Bacteroidales bacterium]|nr:alpha/beta hydrolase [Bacteroidales bacterium]